MKIIVTGGRDFAVKKRSEVNLILNTLTDMHAGTPITYLAEGGSLGADMIAYIWRFARGIDGRTFEAEWNKFGDSAGPIRNKIMLDTVKPDLVVAFPGGRGTNNMIKVAGFARVPVWKVSLP